MEKILYIGCAGTGKTHKIIEKFVESIRINKNVVLLVPNFSQANHLKNLILKKRYLSGFCDSKITTFGNIDKVLCLKRKDVLSMEKKFLISQKIFSENNFQIFEDIKSFSGFHRKFLSFIKTMKENLIFNHNDLKDFNIKPNVEINSKSKYLLNAFFIYQDYLEENGLIDYEDLLNTYYHSIKNNINKYSNINLLVDGFTDFTKLEFKILEELINLSENVYITLPLENIGNTQRRFFYTSKKTFDKLKKLKFLAIELKENHRFENEDLTILEKSIFHIEDKSISVIKNKNINLIKASNFYDEIDNVARIILKEVKRANFDFEDFAVIVRDINLYKKYIQNIFDKLDIPYRIYTGCSEFSGNAFKFLFSVSQFLIKGWKDEVILDILKSGYALINEKMLWEIEKEYKKEGRFNSKEKWLKFADNINLPEFNKFIDLLDDIFLRIQEKSVLEYVNIFKILIKRVIKIDFNPEEIGKNVSDGYFWQKERINDLNILNSVLDDLLSFYGEEKKMEFVEFFKYLKQIILNIEKPAKDRREKVVNIIDVLEARQWEVPVVFVIGMLEKVFPKSAEENILIRNTNLEKFASEKEKIYNDERYLFYISATRAQKKVIFSYPIYNNDGDKNIPSLFLDEIEKILPKEYDTNIITRDFSNILPEKELLLQKDDILKFIALNFSKQIYGEVKNDKDAMISVNLYNKLIDSNTSMIRDFSENLQNLDNIFRIRIESEKILNQIRKRYRYFNVTDFKELVQCFYKFFGKRILQLENLSDIIEKGLDNRVQGKIIHNVLQSVIKNNDFKNIKKYLDRYFKKEYKYEDLTIEEKKIKDDLYSYLKNFIAVEKELISFSEFKPKKFEWSFGYIDENYLIIDIPEIGSIYIKGRIDRIDIDEDEKKCFVIDYKFSKNFFTGSKLEELKTGKELQLFLYSLAVEKFLKLVTSGAAFYTIKDNKRKGVQLDESSSFSSHIIGIDRKEWFTNAIESIRQYIKKIYSGHIEPYPENKKNCGYGKCDFYTLCRFEKWSIKDK